MTHPRESGALQGVEVLEQAFLDAWSRGRLHHAWLLTGPEGVGKASFAYRASRRLLGAVPDPTRGPLGAAWDDPVARLVAAQAHPDLAVLEREVVKGKLKQSIGIDAARDLPAFFSQTPSMAPYRVAIIDTADDLTESAENGLLKTLEEPPARGVLFLVSHAPGALLPTIRSRCRRLAFPPWSEAAVAAFVHERTGVAQDVARRAARLSAGAPGRALSALSDGALELDAAAEDLVRALPRVDLAAISALTDRFRGAEGLDRFLSFFDRLAGHLRERAEAASGSPREAARWAQAWEDVNARAERSAAVNLDRADALWTTVAALKRLAG